MTTMYQSNLGQVYLVTIFGMFFQAQSDDSVTTRRLVLYQCIMERIKLPQRNLHDTFR